jgi:hypothetical protein
MKEVMRAQYILAAAALAGSLSASCAWAWDQDPFAQYIQRSDTITLGAGDAKNVNAATHVIDPWPPYVGNRRIPANGERMTGAVERYRDVSKLPRAPRPIVPLYDRQLGLGTGGGGGGGGGAAGGAGTAPY